MGYFNVVVKFSDGKYCNLKATKMEKVEDVVFVYDNAGFLGMFDLGAVNAIYRTVGKEYDVS